MAGFLKRIFSFGKKEVEETPKPASELDHQSAVDPAREALAPALPEPEPEPEPASAPAADLPADTTPAPEPVDPDELPEPEIEPEDRRAPVQAEIVPEHEPGVAALPDFEPEPEPAQKPTSQIEPEKLPEPEPIDDGPRTIIIGEEGAPASEPEPEADTKSWLARLTSGLSRSSRQLSDNIAGVFTKRKLDDETLEELEDILIQADLGVETAMRVTDTLASTRLGRDISTDEVRAVMAGEVEKVLAPVAKPLELDLAFKPHVILVVGVNGTGKTTTIGKLAAKLRTAGLSVTLGAGDTFRAAAIEQLKIWAERTGSQFVGTRLGADASGLAYEAYEQARDNGSDVVIIDTAGRLQNKAELMDELAKIVRVLQKHDPDAPHTVLQTLDATTGQNALNQVEIFRNVAGVNGLVMTKLDGTARGGILVAISAKFGLPVYFIGVGEGVDDLEPFHAADFASAIAGAGTQLTENA